MNSSNHSLSQDFSEWIRLNTSGKDSQNHIFLLGDQLDDITKYLIKKASKEILVLNPFVEKCNITEALRTAQTRGVKVTLITRNLSAYNRSEQKAECHLSLMQSEVRVGYNNQVHAKVMAIDEEVAIVSSMNLITTSEAGQSIEAGIVSIEEEVVESSQ